MENILLNYLERSFHETEEHRSETTGPTVTVSREFGCPSKLISQVLTDTINHRFPLNSPLRWRYINKEIVESTAKELEMNTSDINYMMSTGAKGLLSDVLASFTGSYVSNHRMRKTIRKVVMDLSGKGRIVIVGRGGAGVLQGYPNVLNIKLQAPLEWRVNEISQAREIPRDEAQKLCEEMDMKRRSLIELVAGVKYNPYLFDLTINCQTMSVREIVQSIIGAMEIKKLI